MITARGILRFSGALLCLLMLTAVGANAENVCKVDHQIVSQSVQPVADTRDANAYNGTLKVYVVEPTSRFRDFSNVPYHFGFLGFAVNQALSLNIGDTLTKNVTFNSTAMSSSNIMVIATVFNGTPHSANTGGNPFTAYYCDATASAIPGVPGEDTASGAYTHTVFLEEGTAQWCQYCPAMSSALEQIWQMGTYQFRFAAMITQNYSYGTLIPDAYNRIVGDYNIAGYPTAFFDGGFANVVGGYSAISAYTPSILAAGARTVDDFYLWTSVEFVSATQLNITVKVYDRDLNKRPVLTQPTTDCVMFQTNQFRNFVTSATDVENDPLMYKWTFGNGDTTDWIGPYPAGDTAMITYRWTDPGTYDVKALVKDTYQTSNGWSAPVQVTVSNCQCGDANSDITIDISDAVFLIQYIFAGGATPGSCNCSGFGNGAGDANGDGVVDISDAVFLIQYIFAGGASPHCSGM